MASRAEITTRYARAYRHASKKEKGLDGLVEQALSGPPRQDHRSVVAATLTPPSKKLWGDALVVRLPGVHLGIGGRNRARAWREYGMQPW